MVVNLWAQTCGPCREEMPKLQAFARKYAGRVTVLGVDYVDPQPMLALEFAKSAGATYPMVADLKDNIRVAGLPTTILLDRNGNVVFRQGMAMRSVAQLEQLVRTHLHVGTGTSS